MAGWLAAGVHAKVASMSPIQCVHILNTCLWWLSPKDMQNIKIFAEWRFLVMQELLGLTAEQREQILAHRHIKLVSLARLVQERRELQVKLQVRGPLLVRT